VAVDPPRRSRRRGAVVLVLLAAAGLALSGWLIYIHAEVHNDPGYVSICAVGERVNCETVAASSWSVLAGAPLAVWGAIGFAILLALSARAARSELHRSMSGVIALICLAFAAVSIALAWISTAIIGALCPTCTGVYLVSFAAALAAWRINRGRGGTIRAIAADMREIRRRPALWGSAALLAGTALGVAPAAVPNYWELASWRFEAGVASGVDDEGRPWIGSRSPSVVIHEFIDYECPHCNVAHRLLRRRLGGHWDEVRLVRHDYARRSCVPNDAKKKKSSCELARAGVCAAGQGRFWEWNDAVMARPRPPGGAKRQGYVRDTFERIGLDLERLDSCLYAPETIERAQQFFREARRNRVRASPMYVLDGEKLQLSELLDALERRL
jgi:uncharacterized membrane protein/protein-disulfide isomerase